MVTIQKYALDQPILDPFYGINLQLPRLNTASLKVLVQTLAENHPSFRTGIKHLELNLLLLNLSKDNATELPSDDTTVLEFK
jgi:hypothetical protein